ncbi:MAG: RDD family protein, partial [bacterium]|nr:RDD family protein [bacterium]
MVDEKNLEDESTEMATPHGVRDPWEEEETPLPQRTPLPLSENEEDETTPIPQTGVTLGSIRDRFASGILDLIVLGYFYLGFLLVYNFIVWRQLLRPIPVQGTHAYVFHGISLLFAFLYFFIAEGVFFTSLGKFFARLSVRRITGEGASLLQVAVRNILRPLDYLLSVFPTWMLLEKLPRRQRVGDLLAGTVVTKHLSRPPRPANVSGTTASATLRLLAGAVDLAFSAAFVGGFALFIDYKRPVFSFLVLILLPLVYLAWHLAWEGIFKTT